MSMKERPRFTCPRCNRSHDRGYVNGVDTFRCLYCGYIGHGFHPDQAIDAKVGQDIRASQARTRADLCNACGGLRDSRGCTNGRCAACHASCCTPGGDTSPGHGYGTKVPPPR